MNNCFFQTDHPLLTQMANNTETVAVKTKFVDVVTEGDLLLSPISVTFSTIVTEASLVDVPPTEGPINEKSITTLYQSFYQCHFLSSIHREYSKALGKHLRIQTLWHHVHQSLIPGQHNKKTLSTSPGIVRRSWHTHWKRLYLMTGNRNPRIQNH